MKNGAHARSRVAAGPHRPPHCAIPDCGRRRVDVLASRPRRRARRGRWAAPRAPASPGRRRGPAHIRAGAGLGRHHRAALLRVRGRRGAAGGHRGRPARRRVGPAGVQLSVLACRGRRRGGRRRLADRPAGPPGGGDVRIRDRQPGGGPGAWPRPATTSSPAPALRSPGDFVPESSRRARGLATWAALQELGRLGVADLVERCCALARRFAASCKPWTGSPPPTGWS